MEDNRLMSPEQLRVVIEAALQDKDAAYPMTVRELVISRAMLAALDVVEAARDLSRWPEITKAVAKFDGTFTEYGCQS